MKIKAQTIAIQIGMAIINVVNWDDMNQVIDDHPLVNKRWNLNTLLHLSHNDITQAKDLLLFDVVHREMRRFYRHRKIDSTSKKKLTGKQAQLFNVVGHEPLNANDLITRFNTTINTIIQHSRFDPYGSRGKIVTRTIDNQLMVWRKMPEING